MITSVSGDYEKVVETLFQRVVDVVQNGGKVVWIEDSGTVPFGQLAKHLNGEQLDHVEYIRIFELEGCIDLLKEVSDGCVLVMSRIGEMFKSRANVDEVHGNYLCSEVMLLLSKLSSNGVDSYVVGDGIVQYYVHESIIV